MIALRIKEALTSAVEVVWIDGLGAVVRLGAVEIGKAGNNGILER